MSINFKKIVKILLIYVMVIAYIVLNFIMLITNFNADLILITIFRILCLILSTNVSILCTMTFLNLNNELVIFPGARYLYIILSLVLYICIELKLSDIIECKHSIFILIILIISTIAISTLIIKEYLIFDDENEKIISSYKPDEKFIEIEKEDKVQFNGQEIKIGGEKK